MGTSLTFLFKGFLHQAPAKSPRRLPLTANLLLICLPPSVPGTALLKLPEPWKPCSCLLFTFLRCSEFTASTIHVYSNHHVCISDSSRFSDTMVFYLKQTKTNRSSPPTPVFYSKVQSPLNPFETLVNFLQFCKPQSIAMTNPPFISESGQLATRFWLHHCLVFYMLTTPDTPSGSERPLQPPVKASLNTSCDSWAYGPPTRITATSVQISKSSDPHNLISSGWKFLGVRRCPSVTADSLQSFPHTLEELEEPRSSTFSFLSFHNKLFKRILLKVWSLLVNGQLKNPSSLLLSALSPLSLYSSSVTILVISTSSHYLMDIVDHEVGMLISEC